MIFIATCNAETYRITMLFLWSRRQQNRRSLVADISERVCQNGMKFYQELEVGLVYPISQTGEIWPRGSPWRAKILKGVKIFSNAFLQGGFTDLDEI